MNKHQADATARRLEAAGMIVTGYRRYDRGSWAVDATDPQTGYPITVDTVEDVGATPTPGARLKYDEPTAQVSITVPVSVLAAADAGGRGKRSAWFVQAARAWMDGTVNIDYMTLEQVRALRDVVNERLLNEYRAYPQEAP